MGKCERCAYRRLGLKRSRCVVCNAVLCENCQMILGPTQSHIYRPPQVPRAPERYEPLPTTYHAVCSWECFDRWAWGFISRGQTPSALGQSYALGGINLPPSAAQRALAIAEDHRRRQMLEHARNLIEAEDHEGAARVYQELEMWKEAGETRRIGRRRIVTQVQVNVNDLVDQVRKAGIATDYACPACKGHIRISGETTLAKLANCEYCGSVIQTTDLVEFLTKVVGYA